MLSHEKPIRSRPRRRLRNSICLIGAVLATYYYLSSSFFFSTGQEPSGPHDGRPAPPPHAPARHGGPHAPELLSNLSLTTAQCEAAFPGLTWPIADAVAQGPFRLRAGAAPVLGRVRGGRLSVLRAEPRAALSAEMLASRAASLHQVHRALLTAPAAEPVPDVAALAVNFQDQPYGAAWAYSRQADPRARPGAADGDGDRSARVFLMPHFSFWAWRLPFVGSVARAAEAVRRIEEAADARGGFAAKIPRAVWRGTTWFSSVHNPRLRGNLVAAAAGKPWADVEALRWDTVSRGDGGRTAENALPIEDFCRYKYVLHTEGVTYSGRFQFLQHCASVLISPPIGWMQHVTHLVRPLFSNTLPGLEGRWATGEMTRRAWPADYAPEEANMVFVAPDWSDLEDVIRWLEDNPKVAEGIARRQRETFVGGGYFSPAAETCYWRALIRGWSEVVRVDESELEEIGEGQTFEAFALTNGD